VDNAGVINLHDSIWSSVETHNSTLRVDPYAGALDGIVGVTATHLVQASAAKLIFNTDVFVLLAFL